MGKKLAIGAVVGTVAGVVAGVLMAPKSGKETRGDIKKKAGELKRKADDAAHGVKAKSKKLKAKK